MPKYILHFASTHHDFHRAELAAMARMSGLTQLEWHHYEPSTSPYAVVTLPSDAAAASLVSRAVLIKAAYRLWASAPTYPELHDAVRTYVANELPTEEHARCKSESFKFTVDVFNYGRTHDQKLEIMHEFITYLDWQGEIDLKAPAIEYMILEAWDPPHTMPEQRLLETHFGVMVGTSSRSAFDKFNLKRRKYLGTTSMDPELSLVMANMAQVRPGSLVYDPFTGTGSFLVTAAHFGGVTVGSDIDGRQIRGTGKGNARSGAAGTGSVFDNIDQYGCADRVLDCLVFDVAQHPWRDNGGLGLFDAIVTDPPYGVRAGAKKIGGTRPVHPFASSKTPSEPSAAAAAAGGPAHGMGRFPVTVPYDLDAVISDLTAFAARNLVLGGRITYWLPTVKSEYHPSDIPMHPSLDLESNCEQPFGNWSRRLITLVKARPWVDGQAIAASGLLGAKLDKIGGGGSEEMAHDLEMAASASREASSKASKARNETGHGKFREKYFEPRRAASTTSPSSTVDM
ncbi:S-adenosyl-L-methionine-dependent methyltransferase [Blastocladiella britannica]|nr:S-adenosyl-L-methionine-dependent methyltransferase [Blastocladiella britannica]